MPRDSCRIGCTRNQVRSAIRVLLHRQAARRTRALPDTAIDSSGFTDTAITTRFCSRPSSSLRRGVRAGAAYARDSFGRPPARYRRPACWTTGALTRFALDVTGHGLLTARRRGHRASVTHSASTVLSACGAADTRLVIRKSARCMPAGYRWRDRLHPRAAGLLATGARSSELKRDPHAPQAIVVHDLSRAAHHAWKNFASPARPPACDPLRRGPRGAVGLVHCCRCSVQWTSAWAR